jgi:hypothetical protein
MRKLIIGLLLLLSVGTSAQWQQTGSKVRYVNGIGIPTKDTAAGVAADSSQILIRPADSSLYVKYKRTWLRVGGGGGSIAGSGTTNYIPKFTSSTAIGNSSIFDNGNVGIGTASPAYPFQVRRAGGAGSLGISIDNVVGTDRAVQYFAIQDVAASSGSGHAFYYRVPNSTTDVLGYILDENGRFGIGTVSPAATLAVQGTTLINTNTDNGVDRLQVSGSMNVSTLATTNNLSVTTNATVGGTLNVNGTTTLGTTNTGAISASSVNAPSGSGTFGNLYSNGIVQMLGVNVKYRNISATYTATTSDDYFINITTGTFTLNLPTAATPYGQVYVIKNSGTGTITVDPNGSQTIDGATTFTMNVQNGSITIISDGTNWKIVSKYL